MNESTPTRPAIGTKVRFAADFRINEGVIESYTRSGRAVVAVEGHKQYTLTLDQLTMLENKATRQHTIQFKVGDAVEVEAVGVPARVVGFSEDLLNIEVVYEDMVEVFTVPAHNVSLPKDKPQAVVHRVAELEKEVAELKRQLTDLIQERNVTRYALRQILAYSGSRYTDDAEVMKEIAEAALDGENITPRR